MRKNWKILSFTGILLLVMLISTILSTLTSRIPSNEISVTGNTGGNLNNHGLFAESEGRVYFSNAYDNGRLYSMNADESDQIRLTDSEVNSINVGGDYLYYYMDSSSSGTGLGYVIRTFGIYRSKLDGKATKCLDRSASITMQLCGDYLYYQHYNNTDFTQLYKIKTDKTQQTRISDSVISPAACHNGIIYYSGTGRNHYLYALDTRTDSISTVYEGNLCYPVYHNDYIYYMDISANYRLCRYSLSDASVEVLTQDRVDTYNVGDSYIYYQRNSTTQPALMRMELDGSNPEVVMEGNFENLNLTSTYAYFNAFGEDTPVYHTPVNGPINVSVFTSVF